MNPEREGKKKGGGGEPHEQTFHGKRFPQSQTLVLGCTLIFFSLLFWETQGKPTKIQGFSVSSEPLKSMEKKKGKNTPKSKEFLEKQESKENPFWGSPLFKKSPPKTISASKMQIDALQNTNCRGEISVYFYTKTSDWRSPTPFWRVSIYILEGANLHFGGRNCLGGAL